MTLSDSSTLLHEAQRHIIPTDYADVYIPCEFDDKKQFRL